MAVFHVSLIDALNNDARQSEIESLIKQSICDVLSS